MLRHCSSLLRIWTLLLASDLILHADSIYVATGWGNQVLRYDSSGNMSVFCNLNGVNDVAVDGQGNVYAVGYSGQVMRYNSNGQGTQLGSGYTYWFNGAAADQSGNFYFGNQSTGIARIDPAGHWSLFATTSGTVDGLAFDSGGNLYAAIGTSIWKFNSLGQGSVFSTQAPVNTMGLAIDNHGYLYAADFSYGRIVKFDSSGNASVFASSGLSGPVGLAFDSSGYLYAANRSSGTIERFDQNAHGTLFASGLYTPNYLAVQAIPEPSSVALLALGSSAILLRRSSCRMPCSS